MTISPDTHASTVSLQDSRVDRRPNPLTDKAKLASTKPFIRATVKGVTVFVVAWLAIQAWQTRHVPSQGLPEGVLSMTMPYLENGTVSTKSVGEVIEAFRQAHPNSPLVLHVWAEWCSFCKLEQGNISSLDVDYPVLSIAMQSGDAGRVAAYMEDRSLQWATLVDTRGTLSSSLGTSGVPTFLVLDTDGKIRAPTTGYTTLLGMKLRIWWSRLW